jgi:hypothetical protein
MATRETISGLGLFVAGLGIVASFAAFAPIMATTWLGGVGLVLAGVGVVLHLAEGHAAGRSLLGSVRGLVLTGALLLACIGGLAYYLQVYMPAHGGLLGGWVHPTPTVGPTPGLYDW